MCELLLDRNLLPLRKFPYSITIYPREYVQITRPEDLDEYDYIASLTENSIVDFNKFRITSSDLNWSGINYFLPIAQKNYLNKKNESVIDFFDGFVWLLGYENGLSKLVSLMNYDDIFLLRNWLFILLKNKECEPDYVRFYSTEIKEYIKFLDKYYLNVENL